MAGLPVAVSTIDQFYASRHCIVCDAHTPAKQPLCAACQCAPQMTTAILTVRAAVVISSEFNPLDMSRDISSGWRTELITTPFPAFILYYIRIGSEGGNPKEDRLR